MKNPNVQLTEEEKQFLDLLASIHLRIILEKAQELSSNKSAPPTDENSTLTKTFINAGLAVDCVTYKETEANNGSMKSD